MILPPGIKRQGLHAGREDQLRLARKRCPGLHFNLWRRGPQSIYYFINYLVENPNSDPLKVARRISNEEFKTYIGSLFERSDAPKRDYLAAVKIANTIFNHPTFEKVKEMLERMKPSDLAAPLTTLSGFLYISQGEI
ncbi:MAG: hypothetical protein QW292_03175 [Candidatus Parvarchaeota archaeon]